MEILVCSQRSLSVNALLLVAIGFALIGCQQTIVKPITEIDFPAELEIEGQTWAKQAWGKKHDDRMASAFKKHAYLAGNPALEGQRVLYMDSRGTVRCYWVQLTNGDAQWMYIEFSGSRVGNPIEGIGAPFQNAADPG